MSIGHHYTPDELADRLQVSVSLVKKRGHSGEWPCLSLGPRTIRFTEDHYREIVALTEHRAKPARQTTRERNKRLLNHLSKAS